MGRGRAGPAHIGCGNAPAPIHTEHLTLLPLALTHAAEMATVLAGPSDAAADWLNWVVRVDDEGRLAGYVQATVAAGRAAELAWAVGVAWQGRGIAVEAAGAMKAGCRAVAYGSSPRASGPAITRRRGSRGRSGSWTPARGTRTARRSG